MSDLRRLWARPRAVALVVVLAPFVVLAVRALVDDAPSPSGDVALIEVRVGDVGTERTPLLGSYGRFGFNHPGPLLFYALAVPYRLAGGRAAGLELGALLLGALSVTAIARVAFRRGGRTGLLWSLVVLGVFLRAVGPAWLLDPWEPHVLPLVAAALIVLSFDAAAGSPSALLPVAAAASLIAQAWATLLPLAVALGGWAVVGLIVHAGRGARERRDVVRAAVVTGVIVAAIWTPPVVQELTRERGNLSAMVGALDDPEPPLGVVDGWRAVSTELGHRASWLGFPQALDGLSPTLDLSTAPAVPVGFVALLMGLAAAAVRRRSSWALGATAVVAIGAATFALSRLLGPIYVWIPQWLRVIGMTTWFAAGWCAFAALPDTARRRARIVLEPTMAVAALVLVVWTVVDAASFDRAADPLGATTRRLVEASRGPLLGLDNGPVLLTSSADANLALGGDDVALEVLVLAVEELGVDVAVPPSLQHQYGSERAAAARNAAAEVRLARADAPVPSGFTAMGPALDPLTPAQREVRASILERVGLPPDASDAEYLRVFVEATSLRADADRLRSVPDLPELRLLVRRT